MIYFAEGDHHGEAVYIFTIDVSVECSAGRHRSAVCAILLALMLQSMGFVCALRPVHLFVGPHDDRGPCGCQDGTCRQIRKGTFIHPGNPHELADWLTCMNNT